MTQHIHMDPVPCPFDTYLPNHATIKDKKNPKDFQDESDPLDLLYCKSQSVVPIDENVIIIFLNVFLPLPLFGIPLWMLIW